MKYITKLITIIFVLMCLSSIVGCTEPNFNLTEKEDILKEKNPMNIVLSQIDSENGENTEWRNTESVTSFFQSLIDLGFEYNASEEIWYFDNSPVVRIIDHDEKHGIWRIDFTTISKEQLEKRIDEWVIVEVKRDTTGKISDIEKSATAIDAMQFYEYEITP